MNEHRLTEDQLHKIDEKMSKYKPSCDVCNSKMEAVTPYTTTFKKIQRVGEHDSLLTFNLICTECGQLKFFSTDAYELRFQNQK